jgi:hypothetical protein
MSFLVSTGSTYERAPPRGRPCRYPSPQGRGRAQQRRRSGLRPCSGRGSPGPTGRRGCAVDVVDHHRRAARHKVLGDRSTAGLPGPGDEHDPPGVGLHQSDVLGAPARSSWASMPNMSQFAQLSTMRPSTTRSIVVPVQLSRPLGARPGSGRSAVVWLRPQTSSSRYLSRRPMSHGDPARFGAFRLELLPQLLPGTTPSCSRTAAIHPRSCGAGTAAPRLAVVAESVPAGWSATSASPTLTRGVGEAIDAGHHAKGGNLGQRRAASSLSHVNGRSRTRTPVARWTALATAAAVPTMPISPMPLAPMVLT